MSWAVRGAAVAAVVASAAAAHAQSNVIWPNDDCAFATPIAGSGAFAFDTSSSFVTTSVPPLLVCPDCSCGTTFLGIESDVWFLWTASCTGPVEMKTGTVPDGVNCNLDTVLAVYNEPCPTANSVPIVCCDDTCASVGNTCDLASYVTFDVECGERYLIRLGRKPGTPGGAGSLKIDCLGDDCPPLPALCTGECCGTAPQYSDSLYANFLNGRVAIMTEADFSVPTTENVVVRIFDLDATPDPCNSLGQNWDPSGTTPPFRYPPPVPPSQLPINDWSQAKLGQVFGLTLDDGGNIYVAHASIYFGGGTTTIGTIGIPSQNTSTTVYKLASGTVNGTPSVFVNLPGGSQAGQGGETEPGLGDVCFDCETGNFFISHFGDGRIYRVDPAGTILDAYDFATNAVSAGALPDPSGPYSTFVPLGERVWAVKTHSGRLYFGVWGHNQDGHTCNGTVPRGANSAIPNRIWSVAINAGGFVPVSLQQELQLPFTPNNAGAPPSFSNPVADLAFSPDCKMVVAERSITDFVCGSGVPTGPLSTAHRARLLEYALNGTTWTTTANYNGANGFVFGTSPALNNCAGGCGIDFETPGATCVEGRYWGSGDQMVAFNVYGMAGFQTSGAAISNTIYIDYDSDVASGSADKTKQGDVELPCLQQCMEIDIEDIDCTADGSGDYSVQFNVTNNSGQTAYYGLVPAFAKIPNDNSVTLSPNVIVFNPPLASGATTLAPIKVVVSGGEEGEEICFNFVIADQQVQECCTTQICVVLEKCCFEIEDKVVSNVVCSSDGTGSVSFDWSFNLVNVSGDVFEHMFLIPQTAGITVTPSYIDLPSVPYGGTAAIAFSVSGATPGAPFSILITTHNAALEECCAELKTGTAPECPAASSDCCECATLPPYAPGCDDAQCEATVCAVDPFCCQAFNGWDCACAQQAAALCQPLCEGVPAACPGDLDGDSTVGFGDMTLLLLQWGPAPLTSAADLDRSGSIGFGDFTALLLEWGPC